jgi:hypothetical protein
MKIEIHRKSIFLILSCILFSFICIYAYAYDEPSLEVVVQEGDNLINIGKKYLAYPAKWPVIAKISRIENPDLIYPGQTVLIPMSMLKWTSSDGTVNFIKGNVEVQSGESREWTPLRLNDRLKEGSRIRTGDESTVEIVFENGDSFLQSPNSNSGLSAARKMEGHHTLYKWFLGAGRTITKIKSATGRESRFEIETPSSICAVRGTVFRTAVDSTDSTRSEVLKGFVDVEGMNQKVKLHEGEGTLVKKGEPPMLPKKLLPPPLLVNSISIYKNIPLNFEFGKVEGAVSYRIIFAKDSDIKDILKEQIIKPADSFKLFEADDGQYFLQSRSIDELGLEGLPSDATPIKVRANPVPPIIESPVDKTAYREKSLTLRWLRVNDAVQYHVQIAEDKEFNRIIETRNDIRELQYETTKLDFKTYYFRISSIAKDDYQGEWSDILSFSIAPSAPALPDIRTR